MKVKRQSKILELIRENDIETQEMLADLLNKAGFNVTQATVSRDIRELKLTKATMQSGKQKYVATAKESSFVTERLNRVFLNKKLKRKMTYQTAMKMDCYKLIKYLLEDKDFEFFSLKEGY